MPQRWRTDDMREACRRILRSKGKYFTKTRQARVEAMLKNRRKRKELLNNILFQIEVDLVWMESRVRGRHTRN